tara:strand:- start:78561 stop:79268 length:708 start_codon:yes stop_codon:yes gene_type:complete
MNTFKLKIIFLATLTLLASSTTFAQVRGAAATQNMTFFVTSAGSGQGGNLGGLAGADARCQALAYVAGAGDLTWHAYLSTQGPNAVNARDRIGSGPWYNAKGTMIARNLDELHREESNRLNVVNALDEHGAPVPYVGLDDDGVPLPLELQITPNVEHDALTGSDANGMAYPAGEDRTCGNWTSNDEGSAMLGHIDRRTLGAGLSPWATAHPSAGCSQQALINTGGTGRFYCFAID